MDSLRIAAAQTPEFREDIAGALAYLMKVAAKADETGAVLVCFPEGFLQGYLLDEVSARRVALDLSSPEFFEILQKFPETGPMLVVGLIEQDGGELFNTALVLQGRSIIGRYRKMHLLAGESIFTPGADAPMFTVAGLRFGINICYDTNFPEAARGIADQGAALIVCPTNNMMPRQRAAEYRDLHNAVCGQRCQETGLWLISADVTGARGDRLALGPTAVLNPQGAVAAQLPLGAPGLLIFDLPLGAQ